MRTAIVLTENPVTGIAFCAVPVVRAVALFGPLIVPYDPLASDTGGALQPPSWRIGSAPTISAATSSAALSSRPGSISRSRWRRSRWLSSMGVPRGRCRRLLRRLERRIVGRIRYDHGVSAVRTGDGHRRRARQHRRPTSSIATAIINLPFYARVARAEANVRRKAGFVQAARLSGNGDMRILLLHIFPNIMPIMMVQISLKMGWAILNAAGLSFIGLGVRPPTPEWGIMVAEGAAYIISGEWWLALFPGAALMLAVFCFNLLGDGLRDLIDPQRRT